MAITDWLMNLAMSKSDKIAKITGRSPSQVKAALQQGQKLIPEIVKTATTPQSGAKILENMGVDKSFIHDTFNKYSKYAALVPGLNESSAKSMLGMLTGAMTNKKTSNANESHGSDAPSNDSRPIFDKSKYPSV